MYSFIYVRIVFYSNAKYMYHLCIIRILLEFGILCNLIRILSLGRYIQYVFLRNDAMFSVLGYCLVVSLN